MISAMQTMSSLDAEQFAHLWAWSTSLTSTPLRLFKVFSYELRTSQSLVGIVKDLLDLVIRLDKSINAREICIALS